MKQKLPIFIFFLLLVTIVPHVSAQTTSTGSSTLHTTDLTASQAARLEKKAPINTRIIKAEDKMQTKLGVMEDNLQTRLDKIASHAATLHAKLQTFRDQKKAAIIDQINTTLAGINKTRTTEMTAHLDMMSAIVTKLEARVTGVGTGKDTASASAAITSAKTAIDTARTAVTTQAGNDYTITVTSETVARVQVKATRDKLFKDLSTTHGLVVAARQAVANAISTASTLLGGQ